MDGWGGGQWAAELLLLLNNHQFVFVHASYGRLPWLAFQFRKAR